MKPRAAYKPRDAVKRYFDEVIALIRTGHSLFDACQSKPEYPTVHSFRRYAQKDAERNRVLREAVAAADAIRRDRRYHRSDDAYDEVLRIIAATPDKRVRAIYRKVMPKGLPHQTMVDRRRRNDPEFAARYDAVIAARPQDIRPDYGYEPKAKPIPRPDGQLTKALRLNELHRKVDGLLPRGIYYFDREDIKSDIIEAVLRGTLCIDEIDARKQDFIHGYYRAQRRHSFRSLDQEMFESESSKVAYVEMLTTDTDINWAA